MLRYALWTVSLLLLPFLARAEEPRQISVEGTGIESVVPDEAHISVAIIGRDQKSSEAVKLNAATTKKLLKVLADAKIDEKNIRTTGYELHQVTKRVTRGGEVEYAPDGFQAVQSISFTVCDLDKFGEIMDAVVSSGVGSVDRVAFSSSKAGEAMEKARKKAVEDAHKKAATLADSAHCKVGWVISISEQSGFRNSPGGDYSESRVAASSPGIAKGTLTYTVKVNVKWEMKPRPLTSGGNPEEGETYENVIPGKPAVLRPAEKK